jgi:tetratricopeptide (TPR) repeat protein
MAGRLEIRRAFGSQDVKLVPMMNCSMRFPLVPVPIKDQSRLVFIALAALLLSLPSATAFGQGTSPQRRDAMTVEGTVRNSAGEPVADATVLLEEKDHTNSAEMKTRTDGTFVFSVFDPGTYILRAEKSGSRNSISSSLVMPAGAKKHVDLVLESLAAAHPDSSGASRASGSSAAAMEFDDELNFTVAGVTDWNNTGIHGSDASQRTSEALVKETLALKSSGHTETSASASNAGITPVNSIDTEEELREAREHAKKMLAIADKADVHRLLGELDERLGDPLEAVHEYERAARLEPSEQNYFEWGTELLLHRADQPAVEVFTKGSSAHPDSARMLAGLGAALYAGGKSEEAARRLCEAADLKPADPAPYLFLGKMEKAAPALLPCSEQKLARFVRDQPGNALGNYYYGIVLLKRDRGSEDSAGLQQAEALLEKAVAIDPKFGEAYLQLGILHSGWGGFEQAIREYKKAIEVSPQLGEPHYRLGLAYRRMGEESKAEQEFRRYEQMEKAETAAIESRRRELRQFLIILEDHPAGPAPR